MIRILDRGATEPPLLTAIANWLVRHDARTIIAPAPHHNVILRTHYDGFVEGTGTSRPVVVFIDGESGSAYSASRGAPISAAFAADIYIGPRANHALLVSKGISCLEIPFVVLSMFERGSLAVPKLTRSRNERRQFCAYLCSNPTEERESFFRNFSLAASKVGAVAVPLGACTGWRRNRFALTSRWSHNYLDDAVLKLSGFAYSLAFENEVVPGYITEKIMNAYLAGATPIYWGSSAVDELFNPATFIAIADVRGYEAAQRAVHECLSGNFGLSRPLLCKGIEDRFFRSTTLASCWVEALQLINGRLRSLERSS
jgi:hypothetical protein